MEITLRKARQIDSKLKSYLDKSFNTVFKTTTGDAKEKLKEFQEFSQKLKGEIQTRQKIFELRFMIRNLVAEANHKSGINTKLCVLEDHKTSLKDLETHFPDGMQNSLSNDELAALTLNTNASILARGGNEYSTREALTTSISGVNKEIFESVTSMKQERRKAIERIEDSLLQLNSSTKIEISKENEELLQGLGLV